MSATEEDSRRIRKFLRRCDQALRGPVFDFRDVETGSGFPLKFVTQEDPDTGALRVVSLDLGVSHLSWDDIDLAATRCRVFIQVKEDNYLPSVMKALMRSVSPERQTALKALRANINAIIKDGQLRGAHVRSGRWEMDNGLGPGVLLGNDQIAMDYINGRLAHEDEEALARLANVPDDDDSMKWSIATKVNDLMQAAWYLRAQIQLAQTNGWLILTPEA